MPSRPLAVAAALLATTATAADPLPPSSRLIASTTTIVRYYPIGLDQQLTLKLKQRIGDSEDILFKTRFWSLEAMGAVNPANWSARVAAEVEPIAVFQLRVAYNARGFFGNFGVILSSDIRPDITIPGLSTATGYPGLVQSLSVEPTLQVAFGPFAIRNTFSWSYGAWSARAGDTVVYDPGPDLLVPPSGVTLTNNANVVYRGERFFAGALYQWLNPLGLPGPGGAGGDDMVHRVGLIGSYTFYDRGEGSPGWFNKPTVLAIALFHLKHPGGRGLFPTVIAVFTTETDLLGPAAAAAATP